MRVILYSDSSEGGFRLSLIVKYRECAANGSTVAKTPFIPSKCSQAVPLSPDSTR